MKSRCHQWDWNRFNWVSFGCSEKKRSNEKSKYPSITRRHSVLKRRKLHRKLEFMQFPWTHIVDRCRRWRFEWCSVVCRVGSVSVSVQHTAASFLYSSLSFFSLYLLRLQKPGDSNCLRRSRIYLCWQLSEKTTNHVHF